jgi:hypothetical protein
LAQDLYSLLNKIPAIIQTIRRRLPSPIIKNVQPTGVPANKPTTPNTGGGGGADINIIFGEPVIGPIGGQPQGTPEDQPDQVTTPTSSPNVYSNQLESGANVYVDVWFRISDLIRVGTDDTRSLQDVQNLQIIVQTVNPLVTDTGSHTTPIAFNSWTMHGGYGPDDLTQAAASYYYRYRSRCILTNVASNWSPATRWSMDPYRQSVTVQPTQYTLPPPIVTSLVPSSFVIDYQRFGGLLSTWNYVGTTPNDGSAFIDKIPDIVAAQNPIELMVNYQPWPILGLPVQGTAATVAGTTVQDSANNFNPAWAPGTRIYINQQPFVIFRVISTSLLEIVNSAGALTNVPWSIPEPTILAQPLPCLWEWDGVWFACGDPINPGRLYYSNPGSETTTPDNYYDLTSPSEPLQNGLQYNLRSYVFSSEAFIQILQTGNPTDPYRHEHIPNGKGMFSRWGLNREPAPFICFLAKDGIYLTTGGEPAPMTDADLYELFPNEGNLGVVINGIGPPNMTGVSDPTYNPANFRLTYYDEYLYFDYIDIHSQRSSLILAFDLGAATRGEAPGGWLWDLYTPAAIMHYGEEGGNVHDILLGCTDGNFYQYTANTSDNGSPISLEFTTPSRDQGDPRSTKLYGDMMLDANTNGLNAICTPYENNNSLAMAPTTVNTPTRTQRTIPITAAAGPSAWSAALNLSLNVTCQVTGAARPFFYILDTRFTDSSAPLAAQSWEFDSTSFGMSNFKHIGLCKIAYSSSTAVTMTMTLDGVPSPVVVTLPAHTAGFSQYIFRVPVTKFKLAKFRIASSDGSNFNLDTRDSFVEIKDWGKDQQYSNLRVFSDYSLVEG